jgi:hypothetical protein
MNEQASGTQVASESSAEQGAQETPQTFIGDDGKFQPGWKEYYVPEEMRTDKVFDTFDDVAGSLKMLGSLQGMIGKKGLIVPGEASPPTEWDNFHRGLGRPDTKDQYTMKVPEDLIETYDENLVAKAREMFWELGYNQKQVDRMWAFEEERIRGAMEIIAKAESDKFLEAKKWGEDNPQEAHLANRIIAENVENQEEKEALLGVIGNNTVVANFLATIGKKFMEHKIITETEQPHGMTSGEALTEAKKIEQTPGFLLPDEKGQLLRDSNRPEYDRLEKERDRLYQLANPG